MKKITRVIMLLLLLGCLVLVGCKKDDDQEITISSIGVVETSIPESILNTELDSKIDDITIQINYSDNNTSTVNLNKSMISSEDLAKLSNPGTHTITVNYEGFSTQLTITITEKEDVNPDINPDNKEDKKNYSVLVKDIAGKPLGDFYVMFYLDNEVVAEGYTGSAGTFSAELEANKYDVVIEGREGYYLNQEMFETDLLGTQIEVICELDSLAGIEGDEYTSYALGDLVYDFTLTNTENEELTLYELLDEYKVVILNFWFTTCSACFYEFPYMIEAYESSYIDENGDVVNYKDEVAIIAVNPRIIGDGGDDLLDVINFQQSMGLTFDVALDYNLDDSSLVFTPALTTMFGVESYPTTVIIDKFGLVADFGVGSVTNTEKWTKTFDKYISDDYFPVYTGVVEDDDYVKPDIEMEDSIVFEEAINGTNHDGTQFLGTYTPEDNENDAEFSWPWVIEEYNGKTCMRPSNQDQSPSFSTIYLNTYLKAGEVLTFDYFSSTENYDILYIVVNDVIATSISNISPNWETSYTYTALEDGEYEFGFCYLKDSSYSVGEDAVYITNMRILKIEDIDTPTYIFRECATGIINEFTMSYEKYVEVFYNEEDGYYHVGSVNGPFLLADLLSGTKWNNSTIYELCEQGSCIGADGVDYNKVIEKYAGYAGNSSIGYCPVTEELANAIKQIVKALGDKAAVNNLNQWLEVCVYYSAYGTNGEELGIPTKGVCYFEPIMFDGNGIDTPATAEGMFDRIILPRGFIFGFIPEQSGVYSFYSTEEHLETLGWICDAEGVVTAEAELGLRLFAKESTEGAASDPNFVSYVYLQQGELYLFRAGFYDITEYSTINVEMKLVSDSMNLLTIASPGVFTSTDDEMSDIISGNYVNVVLGTDGYYHVVGSKSEDDFVYCDFTYLNNITPGYTLLDCLSEKYKGFDFSKDEFGNEIFDEDGYFRVTDFDEEEGYEIRYYVCYNEDGEYFYTLEVGEGEYTEANGYTYVKYVEGEEQYLGFIDCTQYVNDYLEANMITDENSELYGCVKVDEKFAQVLQFFMDKYTFSGVEGSWLKLCYYYRYVGPVVTE